MENLSELANAGIAWVAIACIIALVIVVKAVLKITGNHISHNTEALERNSNKIDEFIDTVKDILKEVVRNK